MRLNEILNERADQAAEIVGLLQSGMVVDPEQGVIQIESDSDFSDYIQQRYQVEKIGEGLYSLVYQGQGNDYVLKDSDPDDNWYKYAEFAKKSSSPFVPKILFAGEPRFPSNSKYGVLEYLEIKPEGHWNHHTREIFWNATIDSNESPFDWAMYEVFELAAGKSIYPEEAEEFLDLIGVKDIGEFLKFINTVEKFGNLDIHDQNIGYRENGELVVFDPVS